MPRPFRIVITVVLAAVAGWSGYWLGHLLGWSTDADWPLSLGGGTGAILTAIGLSVAVALIVGRWLGLSSSDGSGPSSPLPPRFPESRLPR